MRRRLLIAAGLPLAALGAVAAIVVASGGETPSSAGGGAGARGTEVVERRTLVDSATVDGTLGYGASRPALDRRGGTLTWLPRTGAVIHPGERLFAVDGEPVVLMDGTTPAWRTLQVGDEGADVLQLERNLAALGHDPGTVDDAFTSATAAAVRAWQEGWGMTESGRVELGDVVFLPGARRVAKLTGTLGESGGGTAPASWDGGALQTAFASDTTPTGGATTPTTETPPPAATSPTTPPPATTPTTPTTPPTTPTEPPARTTPQARTPPRTTPSTTTPGRTTPDAATPSGGGQPSEGGGGTPAGSGSGSGDEGGAANPGTEVLQTTATERVVTADVDAADQTLARVGARATVELPGGKRLAGRIVKVGTVATGGAGDGGGGAPGEGEQDPTVPVTIRLRSQRGAGRLDQAPVIVELARETRRRVLAVPVTALIARPGGGYAVSVVRGGRARELPVEPGLFADGWVELTGGGVRAGDRIQVPR